MRLFGRKRSDDEVERCPRCDEPLPEEAVECKMCGMALEPAGPVLTNEEVDSPKINPPIQ
jgi:hypothetical protein